MTTIKELENGLAEIKGRNTRVEADKAWETSYARRAIIAAGTYAFSILLFVLIEARDPHLAALVPTLGFVMSTLTLPIFKRWWLRGRDEM